MVEILYSPLDFLRSFIAKQENKIEHNLEIKF